jgi:hypothetical protein
MLCVNFLTYDTRENQTLHLFGHTPRFNHLITTSHGENIDIQIHINIRLIVNMYFKDPNVIVKKNYSVYKFIVMFLMMCNFQISCVKTWHINFFKKIRNLNIIFYKFITFNFIMTYNLIFLKFSNVNTFHNEVGWKCL